MNCLIACFIVSQVIFVLVIMWQIFSTHDNKSCLSSWVDHFLRVAGRRSEQDGTLKFIMKILILCSFIFVATEAFIVEPWAGVHQRCNDPAFWCKNKETAEECGVSIFVGWVLLAFVSSSCIATESCFCWRRTVRLNALAFPRGRSNFHRAPVQNRT